MANNNLGRAKVEKFKLTPEQIEWQKAYKKLMGISKFLQTGMAAQLQGAQRIGDLLGQTDSALQTLINRAPQTTKNELEGQE